MKAEKSASPTPLIPPDRKRCQTEWKSGSFMTLGPRRTVRCPAIPTVIAVAKEPDEYGRYGSMSLCDEHLAAIQKQMPGRCTFKPIKRRAE